MKVICAWHQRNFGYSLSLPEKPPFDDLSVSHGICGSCLKIETNSLKYKVAVYVTTPQESLK